MRMQSLLMLLAVVLVSLSAASETVLFDFEQEADFNCWEVRSAKQDTWEASTAFASRGTSSGLFISPKWEKGMAEWPAFEVKPPVQDWSPYDRFVFDLVNPTDHVQTLKIYITDSDTKLQEGASLIYTLQPRSYQRATAEVKSFPKGVNPKDITRIHCYTTRPPERFAVHLDAFLLLKPGEEAPAPAAAFMAAVKDLMFGQDVLKAPGQSISTLRKRYGTANTPQAVAAWVRKRTEALQRDYEELKTKVASPTFNPEDAEEVTAGFSSLNGSLKRADSMAQVLQKWIGTGGDPRCVVGTASSMEKILPRAESFDLGMNRKIAMELARGETESFQVVVVPFGEDLRQAKVTVGALESGSGQRFPSEAVSVDVVGYVKTGQPTYEVSYTGWWPDPLLDFLPAADVAEGDAQAFWVRIKAPRNQAPGLYSAPVKLTHAGGASWESTLSVRVHSFTLPEASPLPTAISLYLNYVQKFVKEDWDTFVPKLSDFLADYYIDYDSLYRQTGPEFDVLKRLDEQGRLVAFNLRYFHSHEFPADLSDEAFEKKIAALKKNVRAIYDEAVAAGIADKAYCYGFDECRPEFFPVLQRICSELKEVIPDVPLMTTTYDHSYGTKTCIKAMDAWVPLTPKYDPELAEQVRKEGKQVWWYICCGPAHPYANWFVEYPAIETRLLMGAMTAKYRPDGFLYYTISRWPNNSKPIESGPFTTWNPASFKTFNGDGSLFCPGPGGRPLPTVRLENFRDGLEDYAYSTILEKRVNAYRKKWDSLDTATKKEVEKAEKALDVPETLVESMSSYSHDPEALYAYRHQLAAAIEALSTP